MLRNEICLPSPWPSPRWWRGERKGRWFPSAGRDTCRYSYCRLWRGTGAIETLRVAHCFGVGDRNGGRAVGDVSHEAPSHEIVGFFDDVARSGVAGQVELELTGGLANKAAKGGGVLVASDEDHLPIREGARTVAIGGNLGSGHRNGPLVLSRGSGLNLEGQFCENGVAESPGVCAA